MKNPRLSEDYFISSFMSGLKEELKPTVRMMKPQTLMEEFEVAVLQEQAVELSAKKFKANVSGMVILEGYHRKRVRAKQ